MMIVVEGVDRAGKTTECRRIMAAPRKRPAVLIHFVAPPAGQSALVLEEMARVYTWSILNPDVDFVLDRGHVSWFVYEELRKPGSVTVAQLRAFEAKFAPHLDARTVLLTPASAWDLLGRDDGKSTWTRDNFQESHLAVVGELRAFEKWCAASSFGRAEAGRLLL